MGNPVLSQLIMNTSKPLFLGTTAHFPEFQRSWDEYLSLLKATQPGLQEAQILALFKTSLDPASGTQLKRLMEQKPTITTEEYMRIMEKTFGQDASGQTRQAWRNVQLRLKGGQLEINGWRDFQQQFELAASRVDDKGEREEFDLVYKQLPPFWQDKIVKDQQRKDQSKYWVRIGALPGFTMECLEDLLKQEDIKYRSIQTTHNGFNVQGKNEVAQDKLLALTGGTIGSGTIKTCRTQKQMDASDIFKNIGDQLRALEDAEAIRISLGTSRRVSALEWDAHRDEHRDDAPRRYSSPRDQRPEYHTQGIAYRA